MSTPPGNDAATKATFAREIFVSRMLKAIVWSIVLQCVYVSHVLFLMNTDILHPVQWIKNAYLSISSLGTWFYLLPLGVMTFAQGVLMSKDLMKESPCIRSRFGILCSALQLKNIVMAVVNMVFGAMVVSYYSALLGEETNILSRKCGSEHGKCLNERNLYLISLGVWIGLYASVKRQIWEVHCVMFPMVQQLKSSQVKMRLAPLVLQSFKEAVLPYLYFCVLYWWSGSYLREHLSGFLGLPIDEDSIMPVFVWMKPFLILRCLLFSAIIILTGRTLEMLFQVFLTEHCHFPITSTTGDYLTLNDVLASPLPMMKRLGYLDLLHIAERDTARQGELFSLSLPGGHPHNWNGVVTEVLAAIDSFSSGLSVAVSDINRASNGSLLPSSPPNSNEHNESRIAHTSPVLSSPTSPSLRLRNMSIYQANDLNTSFAANSMLYTMDSVQSRQKNDRDLMTASRQQLNNVLQWICRKPGINLLFGEMEDATARHLLLHSQHLSWGAQALAHLSAASLKRDVYGVVQKDLPAIIKSLVLLKNVLERLPLHHHKRALRPGSLDLRLKAALTSAVRRSLYILSNAFGQYLADLPLSEDLKQVLSNYVSYKEG